MFKELSSNIGVYIFSYIILPFILLYNLKFTNYNSNFLSKEITVQVKGLMALVVVLVHVALDMKNGRLMTPYAYAGHLAVGTFLFLSGYGLMESRKTKSISLKHSIYKKLNKVYLPFFIINLVTIPIYYIFLGKKYTLYMIICYATGIKLIDDVTWFVITILLFYICFYILFSILSYKQAFRLFVLVSIVYSLFCFLIGNGSFWFNTAFCFPIGIYISLNSNKIDNILKNIDYSNAIFLSTIIFSTLFFLLCAHHHFGTDRAVSTMLRIIFEITSSAAFIVLLLLILIKIEINSRILAFLGLISYEIYLLHMKIYTLYSNNGSINIFYYITIVIILSALFNKIVSSHWKKAEVDMSIASQLNT